MSGKSTGGHPKQQRVGIAAGTADASIISIESTEAEAPRRLGATILREPDRLPRVPTISPEAPKTGVLPTAEAHVVGGEDTTPVAQRSGEIIGWVDGMDGQQRITGWAYAPATPYQQVQVSIVDADKVVASATANLLRPDVREAGHGDGYSGFAVRIPSQLFDGRVHHLTVPM